MADFINRFENACIAKYGRIEANLEEASAIKREYLEAKANLVEQFAIFSGHSDQAADVANILAQIEDAVGMDIVVCSFSPDDQPSILHPQTELLNDHLDDILGTHGRPFGQA